MELKNEYIEKWKKEVEQKLGQDCAFWTNSSFVKLSDDILKITGEYLSHSTMKRIWGKTKSEVGISKTTLNILARYIGFDTWDQFIESNPCQPVLEGKTEEKIIDKEENVSVKKKNETKRIFIPIAIIFLIIFGIIFFKMFQKEEVFFKLNQTSGKSPFTINFYAKISHFDDSKNYILDFGDGDISFIKKNTIEISHEYKRKGIFWSKVIENDKVLARELVISVSDGWESFYSNRMINYPIGNCNDTGNLKIDTTILRKLNILKEQHYWSGFDLIGKDLKHVKLDSFILEMRIKTMLPPLSGVKTFGCTFVGKSGSINLMFLSDTSKRGDWTISDISSKNLHNKFILKNPEKWNTIKLSAQNQKFNVFVNDSLIFDCKYKNPIGSLLGINLRFTGCGEVDYFVIKDNNGKIKLRK